MLMYGVVIACLMKSVIWSYSAQLNEHRPASEVQGLSSQRLYAIAGRNESNNRQGFKIQVGYHPYLNVVLVAYLDQGRSDPLLHDLTKLLLPQLPEQ